MAAVGKGGKGALKELVRLFVERVHDAARLCDGVNGGVVRLVDLRRVEDFEAAGACGRRGRGAEARWAVAAPNATLAAPRAQRTLVENAVELLVQDHLRQLPLDRLQRQLDNLRNMRNLQARGGGEGGSEGK